MPDADTSGFAIAESPVESARFGLRIFRGTVDELDPDQILAAALAKRIDIAMLRLPAEREYQLARLNDTGLPWLAADTLVWYECSLADHEPPPPSTELAIVQTRPEHAAVLDGLAAGIFAGYRNHYYSNPLLDRGAILDAYRDWARGYVTDESRGRVSWLARRDDRFVGFITCSYKGDAAEIVLNGVEPTSAGRGIYTELVRAVQRHFKVRGAKRLRVSTQAHNDRAQRVWGHEGFVLKNACVTFHVNALMAHSVIDPLTFDVPATAGVRLMWQAAVETAEELCWRRPPLGPGAHETGCAVRFLLAGTLPARATVTLPVHNAAAGYGRSLLRISGGDGQVACFSYHDFALAGR